MKSKQEYLVEAIEMSPENMAHIEKNLSILAGENPDTAQNSETNTVAPTNSETATPA